MLDAFLASVKSVRFGALNDFVQLPSRETLLSGAHSRLIFGTVELPKSLKCSYRPAKERFNRSIPVSRLSAPKTGTKSSAKPAYARRLRLGCGSVSVERKDFSASRRYSVPTASRMSP